LSSNSLSSSFFVSLQSTFPPSGQVSVPPCCPYMDFADRAFFLRRFFFLMDFRRIFHVSCPWRSRSLFLLPSCLFPFCLFTPVFRLISTGAQRFSRNPSQSRHSNAPFVYLVEHFLHCLFPPLPPPLTFLNFSLLGGGG